MNRVARHRHVEPLAKALDLLPPGVRRLLGEVPVLTGVDPRFAGLHRHEGGRALGNRSYANTMHVVYPCHQPHLSADRRETTVVVPGVEEQERRFGLWSPVASLVHELGHVLDDRLGLDPAHALVPVCEYAAIDRYEAFACAFQTWAWGPPPRGFEGRDGPYERLWRDRRAVALFESLG